MLSLNLLMHSAEDTRHIKALRIAFFKSKIGSIIYYKEEVLKPIITFYIVQALGVNVEQSTKNALTLQGKVTRYASKSSRYYIDRADIPSEDFSLDYLLYKGNASAYSEKINYILETKVSKAPMLALYIVVKIDETYKGTIERYRQDICFKIEKALRYNRSYYLIVAKADSNTGLRLGTIGSSLHSKLGYRNNILIGVQGIRNVSKGQRQLFARRVLDAESDSAFPPYCYASTLIYRVNSKSRQALYSKLLKIVKNVDISARIKDNAVINIQGTLLSYKYRAPSITTTLN